MHAEKMYFYPPLAPFTQSWSYFQHLGISLDLIWMSKDYFVIYVIEILCRGHQFKPVNILKTTDTKKKMIYFMFIVHYPFIDYNLATYKSLNLSNTFEK